MPKWPCPECGARRGRTHKTTCRHAQRTRWRTPDQHNPVVYKTRGSVQYLRCSRCHKPMGKRPKRLCLRGRARSPAAKEEGNGKPIGTLKKGGIVRLRLRSQMYAVGVICASILTGALVAWLVTNSADSGGKHDGGVKSQLVPSEVTRPVLRDGTPWLSPASIRTAVQPAATRKVAASPTLTPARTRSVTAVPTRNPPTVQPAPSTPAPSSTTPAPPTPTPTLTPPTTPPPATTTPTPATTGAAPTATP